MLSRMLFMVLFTTLFTLTSSSEESLNTIEEECGHQIPLNKIMDGEVTAIDEFPWMALLEYKNRMGKSMGFGCSGTLISKKHVLTTSHCIKETENRELELFSVRLGEYNISSEIDCVEMFGFQDCADPPQDILVEKWISHPTYHKHINDIALIKLTKNANFTDFVRPICLPSSNNNEEVGQILVVAGWGRTEKKSASAVKLKLNIPVVTFSSCYEKYRATNTILNASQHLCAGSVLGKDACSGDSGGPLMTLRRGDGRWKIVGIISTGNSCGLEGWPGIYIRVLHYHEWILDQIKVL